MIFNYRVVLKQPVVIVIIMLPISVVIILLAMVIHERKIVMSRLRVSLIIFVKKFLSSNIEKLPPFAVYFERNWRISFEESPMPMQEVRVSKIIAYGRILSSNFATWKPTLEVNKSKVQSKFLPQYMHFLLSVGILIQNQAFFSITGHQKNNYQ